MRYDPKGDLNFQLEKLLNSGLNFADNFESSHVELVTTGEDQEIGHELGHVPSGFIKVLQTAECSVWATRRDEWTTEKLFLRSNVPNVTVRLLVM